MHLLICMALNVAATANMTTYQADPQRVSRMTFETAIISNYFRSLYVSAHWTAVNNY